ncbi:MAG TPA: hypothetical protein VKH43_06340 [Thermoanaerobaculia bacterium]|nr:hypothetical protein [Thermoanaerobaculia bacterium]
MRLRGLVVLVLAAGVGYWIYKTRPTVTSFVDGLTRPLMRSKAVVKESESRRVLSEAVPAAPEGEDVKLTMIHEGMKRAEIEELIGKPDSFQQFDDEGKVRFRAIYVAARRIIVYEEGGRAVSIAVAAQ